MNEPTRRDRTVTYGIWALVGAVFCLPLGIIMIILSWQEARRNGRSPVLAIVALVLLLILTIVNIRYVTSGGANRFFNS